MHERLRNRKDTLDEALTDLGISPHPRVVLALEGETEVYHAPLVWRTLGYSSAPELIWVLKLGGVGQNLQKVAALNVAPLIGIQVPAPGAIAWTVIRPLAHLLMAVDPDKPNPSQRCRNFTTWRRQRAHWSHATACGVVVTHAFDCSACLLLRPLHGADL